MNTRSNVGRRFYDERPRINHTGPMCCLKNKPASLRQCGGGRRCSDNAVAVPLELTGVACALLRGLDSVGIFPTGVVHDAELAWMVLGARGSSSDGA
jgi:hypothetical protein